MVLFDRVANPTRKGRAMPANLSGTVPVILLVKGTSRDVKLLRKRLGTSEVLIINLTDPHELWWLNPLVNQGLSALQFFQRGYSHESLEQWVESEEFVSLARDYIWRLLTRELGKYRDEEWFSRRWMDAVELVYVNPYIVKRSPFLRRVFDGFFGNAEVLYADVEGRTTAPSAGSEMLTWPIEKLGLSNRLQKVLSEHDIKNVGLLRAFGERGLLKVPGIGKASIKELQEAFERAGTSLPSGH